MTVNNIIIDSYTIKCYVTAFVLSILFAFIYSRRKDITWKPVFVKPIAHFIQKGLVVLPWTVLCANRAVSVGYDTRNYFNNYFNIGRDSGFDMTFLTDSPGYYLLNKITYNFDKNTPAPVFFVMAFITLFIVISSLEVVSDKGNHIYIGFAFFILMFGLRMMDQSRQFIAVAFTMLAFAYLAKNDKIKFYIYMIVGFVFHTSCIIFIVFGLLDFKKITRKTIGGILLFASIFVTLYMEDIVKIVYKYLPKAYSYIARQSHTAGAIGVGGMIDILPAFMFLLVYYVLAIMKKVKYNYLPLEVCVYTVLPFRIAGYSSYFFMRLFYYGATVAIVLELLTLFELEKTKDYFTKALYFIQMMVMMVYCYVVYFYLNSSMIIPYIKSK